MTVNFEAPENVRFTCTKCGDCCRTWNVALAPGERESIEALDWTTREIDLVGAVVTVQLAGQPWPPRHRLARHEDGACVFLGKANQCRIHEHFGADAKPLVCRMYPFAFYPMGESLAVDVSFACRSVASGAGEPIRALEPEWRSLVREAPSLEDRTHHQLSTGRMLSGELVWEIERIVLQLLSDRSMSLFDRIRCALEFSVLGTTGNPSLPSARVLREAMAAGIPKRVRREPFVGSMDRSQRALFYQWTFLALNPVGANFDLLGQREREEVERTRVTAGNRFRDNKGKPWVDGRELSVTFKEIAKVDATLLGDGPCEPLETFFAAKIVGQKFLASPAGEQPLIDAAHVFFLSYPITIWTSRALAAERGSPRVEDADVRAALRLVDWSLGQLALSGLPKKQAEACEFLILHTDMVMAAASDLLAGR